MSTALPLDLFRPVDRASSTRPTCLASSGVKRRSMTSAATSGTGSARAKLSPTGTGMAKIGLELLDQQVVVELAHRLALERLGVRRQQLAEELLLRRLRPADQLHALVQVLHQRRQLHQELLAERRRALGLHAHHQVGADAPVALGAVGVGAVAARGEHQRLAPDLGQELAAGKPAGRHRRERRLQLQHVALLHAQLRSPWPRASPAAPVFSTSRFGLLGDEVLELGDLGGVELDLVEVALDDLVDQLAARAVRNCAPGPSSKSSKALASEAMRLMKRRTGWRRVEKKVESLSATRSTGSCSRAISRAICGGTRESDRIWSNRLPTTSITM